MRLLTFPSNQDVFWVVPHASGRGENRPGAQGIGDDKIRVNSSSLDHPLTILPDQAIEIVAIEKKVMVGRVVRSAYWRRAGWSRRATVRRCNGVSAFETAFLKRRYSFETVFRVARQLVEARDDEMVFEKPVSCSGGFELVVGQNFKRQMKTPPKFVLRLLGQTSGTHDETALQVAARDQLLHQEAGHDCLAGAGIVGEQEPQRLARQHRFVDGRDLMRQGIDYRGMASILCSHR
jgi:hypothetical protein